MEIDRILKVFAQEKVRFLLIGGVNFLLRHQPNLTYDVDLWIEPSASNRVRCERALAAIDAEWGKTDESWQKVANYDEGWLTASQSVYCLASPLGAIDIFLEVKGLGEWIASFDRSIVVQTSTGNATRGLNDEDMLACQLALEPHEQKQSRIEYLQNRRQET